MGGTPPRRGGGAVDCRRAGAPGGEGAMKLGLFLNTQLPEGDSLPARLPELVEQVRLARASGFASLWFPDHTIIGPVQMPQPVPLMAWLLREAEGMVVGPNIRILPLLNPVLAAEEAATMDLLSGGRYVFGVGLGYRQAEEIGRAHG